MTAAAHREVLIAVVILVPEVLYLAHRLFGDLAPAVIVLGGAAFVIFVLPRFPASPVACLAAPKGCATGRQLDWVAGLAFVAPMGLACLYKALRGDTRGAAGRRLP